MPARWMQQKQAKMRRARRAYLKPYSLHMGNRKPPNKEVIKEYQERAANLYTPASEEWLDTLFPGPKSPKKGEPRRDAMKTKEAWKVIDELERHVVVERTRSRKLVLFFNSGSEDQAYFVETSTILNRVKTSILYRTPFIARQVYQMGQIHWDEDKTKRLNS